MGWVVRALSWLLAVAVAVVGVPSVERIKEIHSNPDEIRQGPFYEGDGGSSDYLFLRKGDDLLILKPSGEFVSLYPVKDLDNYNWWNRAKKVSE